MSDYEIRHKGTGFHGVIEAKDQRSAIRKAQEMADGADWTLKPCPTRGKYELRIKSKEEMEMDEILKENEMKNFKIWDARNEHVAYLEAEDVEAAKDKASAWANKIHWGPGVQFVALYVGELDPNDTDVVISKTLITVFFDSSLENETDRVPEEEGDDDDVLAITTLDSLCDLVKEFHRHIEALKSLGSNEGSKTVSLAQLRIARLMDTITDIAQRHTGGPNRINVDLGAGVAPGLTTGPVEPGHGEVYDQTEIAASGHGDQDLEETAGSSLSG